MQANLLHLVKNCEGRFNHPVSLDSAPVHGDRWTNDFLSRIHPYNDQAYFWSLFSEFESRLNYRKGTYPKNPEPEKDAQSITPKRIRQPAVTKANLVPRVLSAIYWDLKSVSKDADGTYPLDPVPTMQVYVVYAALQLVEQARSPNLTGEEAIGIVEGVVDSLLHEENKRDILLEYSAQSLALFRRYALFLDSGWALGCVLAYSRTFYLASMLLDEDAWYELCTLIFANTTSIFLWAVRNGIGWRYFLDEKLLSLEPQPENLVLNLPFDDLQFHPQDKTYPVILMNGGIGIARYNLRNQIDTTENFFNHDAFAKPDSRVGCLPYVYEEAWPYNPLLLRKGDGEVECCSCKQKVSVSHSCSCTPEEFCYSPMVELVEYPNRGRGLRVLEDVPSDVVLGEYMGDIRPAYYEDADVTYTVMATTYRRPDSNKVRARVSIDSAVRGNWTRYMNHGCESHCQLISAMVLGNQFRQLIATTKPVNSGDQLEMHYGFSYFGHNRLCKCHSPKCHARTFEQTAFVQAMVMIGYKGFRVEWDEFSTSTVREHIQRMGMKISQMGVFSLYEALLQRYIEHEKRVNFAGRALNLRDAVLQKNSVKEFLLAWNTMNGIEGKLALLSIKTPKDLPIADQDDKSDSSVSSDDENSSLEIPDPKLSSASQKFKKEGKPTDEDVAAWVDAVRRDNETLQQLHDARVAEKGDSW